MGRKSVWESQIQPKLPLIKEMMKTHTEAQIAKRIGVSTTSFEKYKREKAELRNALQTGKEGLISELKDTLKQKAKGFHYKETKKIIRQIGDKRFTTVEEYERYSPPDTGAIHLLLKNLDETWTNDDKPTMELKKQKIELDKQKAESENW